ncbi:MAG: hypothetical protein FWC53_04305, partial [Firmicutes bacterium]|nr:hypothetical protein [Bacillota bacterium]
TFLHSYIPTLIKGGSISMNSEDLSSIFKKLNIDKNSISDDSINNFLNMLGHTGSDETSHTSYTSDNFNNESNSSGIDMETLLRMKSIMDEMNSKDDPRSNLLMSLKPYLKESRKGKVDQYIQLMNMSKILEIFPFMGGDKKNNE